MGTPAEHRSLLAHLINIRTPYSYENPRFVLMCEGITELTEELEPDSEDIQYICEKTKTTNVKSYSKKLEVDMTYVKDNEIINYANYLLRTMPVGQKAAGDYVRLNKDELMYSENNSYIAVRQRSTVYPESIGGSAEDPLHSKFSMGSAGDQVVGYVTINTLGSHNTYLWTQANLEVPYVTKIGNIKIEDFYKNMSIMANGTGGSKITFELQGKTGSTIKLYKGVAQEVNIESTVWDGDKCTCTVNCSDLFGNDSTTSGKVTLAFQQFSSAESSVTTQPIVFNLIKGTLSAPTITSPSDATITTLNNVYTFAGTANEYATVNLTNAANSSNINTIADANGRWSANISLKKNSENVISVTQSISGVTSSAVTKTINCLSTPAIDDGQTSQTTASFHVTGEALKGATIHLFKDGTEIALDTTDDGNIVDNNGEFDVSPDEQLTAGKYKFTVKQVLNSVTSPSSSEVEITLTGS